MRDHSPGFIVPSPIPLSTLEAARSKSVAERPKGRREGSEVVVGSAGGRSVDGLQKKSRKAKKKEGRRKKGNQLSGQSTVINDNRM